MKQLLSSLLFFCLTLGLSAQNDSCLFVSAELTTASWGEEIGYDITDTNGNIVYSHSPGDIGSNESVLTTLCLEPVCHLINMYDTFGDGWNGGMLTIQSFDGLDPQVFTLQSGEYGIGYFNPLNSACDSLDLVFGCTDSTAINYDPLANVDNGSCQYPAYGCTDPAALNYMQWATVDDGSCIYPLECDSNQTLVNLYVCVFSNGQNVGFEIVSELGDTVYSMYGFNNNAVQYLDLCLDQGVCYTATMSNIGGGNESGWYNGYWWANANGFQLITESLDDALTTESVVFSVDGTCGEIFGCTDPEASNYNPDATSDDGSCYYPIENDLCADATAIEPGVYDVNNSSAYLNENIYGECWNSGGGEGEQTSVWYSFTTPDGPAHITLEAISDGTWTLTDTQFGLFEECGGEMIHCDGNGGQGLYSRFDFDCGVLDENTTYLLVIDGWYGDAGTCQLVYTSTSECGEPILGCTDPIALNYDETATVDDGNCIYEVDSCEASMLQFTLTTEIWGSEISFDVVDDQGNLVASFSGYENNSTYYQTVCVTPGCYTLILEDSFGDGWNGGVLTVNLDGQTILTDVTLPGGTVGEVTFGVYTDDCDFVFDLEGCTDPSALNYNPLATIDDGSCFYGNDTTYNCMASFEVITVDYDSNMVIIVNTSIGSDLLYFWDFGDGSISEEQFPQHTYTEEGDYMVCLVIYNDFCEDVFCDTISYIFPPVQEGGNAVGEWHINVIPPAVTALDENELSTVGMTVFPNPAVNEVTLSIDTEDLGGLRYQLIDVTGRLMMDRPMNSAIERIDVQGMSDGIYLLRLLGENGAQTQRVEIRH